MTAPPPWADPAVGKKLQIGGGAVLAVGVILLLIVGATTLFGGGSERGAGAVSPQTPATIDTSSSHSVLGCQEIRSPERSESSGQGDTDSPDGLIIAYEHAFFDARDARGMVSLSVPSPSVATEEQLAASIKEMPVDTPWCVSITPAAEPDSFDVSVRFVESDGTTVTTWNQTMTVVKNPEGQWNIVGVRGR
ncbi:hypothetical protein [Rhodococcus sp. (in: high G+C Gram-positive bacteria)]|uniref:hypothetical protein n=1 Tax=Rhodococcus sp. TaxID=1831 RepID=UPI003BAFF830